MNTKIANAASIYFETLFELNQKLILLCGKGNENFEDDKTLLDVIHNIPRVIPFGSQKGKTDVCIQNKNGLLEFKDEVSYLEVDYKAMIEKHQDTLVRIKQIRNKSEHIMHRATVSALLWDSHHSYHFTYDFNFIDPSDNGADMVSIELDELIALVKDLNVLFSKLQNDIQTMARDMNLTDTKFYDKVSSFDFSDFNRVYDSELLGLLGKIIVGY